MRPYSTSHRGRRGTVTVIVVAFLALFFVMALTFAFYSIAESDNAKAYRDAAAGLDMTDIGGPDPYPILNETLSQIIYGPEDGVAGAFTGLRGHDLSRTIYGYDKNNPTAGTQAFNGYGRAKPSMIYPFLTAAQDNMINYTWVPSMFGGMMLEIDNNDYRNPKLLPGDPAYRVPPDPTWTPRYYAKNANYTYPDLNNLFLAAIDPKTGKPLTMSFHRRDLLKDTTLGVEDLPDNPPVGLVGAATDPRGSLMAGLGGTNPWLNSTGRLFMIRPRPVDNQWPAGSGQSYFRYPNKNADGSYGDVVNLEGKPGAPTHYDSVWIDIDAPVGTYQGKLYKPLVALLITDLDGRVNINTAGNFFPLPDSLQPAPPTPPQYYHASGQGLGPWEVNPALVMGNNNNDAAQLSRPRLVWRQPPGDPAGPPNWKTAYPLAHNRFGGNGYNAQGFFGKGAPERKFRVYPNENIFANQPSPGTGAHFYGPVNFDGFVADPVNAPKFGQGQGHSTTLVYGPPYQGTPGNSMNPPRPDPLSYFGNGLFIPGVFDERTDHLSMYNPYLLSSQKQTNPANAPDRSFGVEELRYMNGKYNYAPTEQFIGSDLAKLANSTLGNPVYPTGTLNSRFAITPLSNDIHSPGASPWLSAPIGASYTLSGAGAYPTGSVQTLTPTNWTGAKPGGSADHDEFYRAKLAALGPVDLDRKLTDYRMVASQPLSPTNVGYAARAIQDRQQLAQDIFVRLRYATTGETSNGSATPGTPAYNALRWLAQLAVNIVDYIDADDMMTPFHWNSTSGQVKDDWVYGFERPRLVMNETYVRYENEKGDMGQASGDAMYPNNKKPSNGANYSMRCWIELHNPITPANAAEQNLDPMGDDGTNGGYRARLEEKPLQNPSDPMSGKAQSAYRVLVYQIPTNTPGPDPMKMRDPENVLGLPKLSAMPAQPPGWPKIVDFSDTNKVKSSPGGKTVDPNIGAQMSGKSFYILGPDDDAAMGNDAKLPDGSVTANLTHTELKLPVPQADLDSMNMNVALANRPTWTPAFVLQRLANPLEIYSGPSDPLQPPSNPANPYITVDYIEPDLTGKSIYDRVQFRYDYKRGPDGPEMMQPDLNTTYAWGRRQPHDARIDFANDQAPPSNKFRQGNGGAAAGSVGGHSFGSHNAKNSGAWPAPAAAGNYASTWESPGSQTNDTLQVPFLPLNHLDRVLLSPAELLHVVAVKPHELTQSFYMAQTDIADPTKRRIAYTANWLDSPDTALPANKSTFLFRALDYLRTPSWIEGVPFGGRIPGKLNVNTVFADITGGTAPGHFQAIADPSTGNRFTATEVNTAWNAFTGPTGRHPSAGQITINDKPLQGLATAVSAAGIGGGNDSQDQTYARRGALWQHNSNDEAFQAGASPGAMQKYELLSKTLNQMTTRSNTFTIHATIGYFEVMNTGPYNENNRPVLGAEIGSDTGNVTRHKFFAVVDRTNLTIEPPQGVGQPQKQGQAPAYLEYNPYAPLPQAPAYAFTPDPDLKAITPPMGQKAQVMVRIPATSFTPASSPPTPPGTLSSVSGLYDGRAWTIMSDPTLPAIQSYAILGSGLNQEMVLLKLPPNAPPYAFDQITKTAHVILESTQADGKFIYPHHRGEAIRLMNPDPLQPSSTPGSPGPQTGFQYNAPRYSPVVKYVEQLN